MTEDAALWTWFVFDSGLPTQRAKALLESWQAQGIALAEALMRPQSQTTKLGITSGEAGLLASGLAASAPAAPVVPALTWCDALYPSGLRSLPLKVRPALLFYQGDPALLSRMLVYLAPGAPVADALAADSDERTREVIGLLLDEHVLIATFEGTPQATLALDEMAMTEGELLLFTKSGLGRRSPTGLEQQLLEQDRLILLSPLPPNVAHLMSLDPILRQVAWYASNRVVLTADPRDAELPAEWLAARPVLELAGDRPPRPDTTSWTTAIDPTDVLAWVEGQLDASRQEVTANAGTLDDLPWHQAPSLLPNASLLDDATPLPALSPDEILKTLSQGGTVPEVLRQRLLKGRGSV